MLDHQEARLWADHHTAFTRWVSDTAHSVADAFAVLTENQYDAPWRSKRGHDGRSA